MQATNASGWPALFGVVVTANTVNPANLDLAVVYNPPGGAAGIQKQVVVEQFTDLSLNTADPNYAATAINSASQLIRVPASYLPPATPPAGFPATPTTLSNTGSVDLQDLGAPAITYLTLEAANPSSWTALFGVTAQPNTNPIWFDLEVVYDPHRGRRRTLPVAVESFTNLSLSTVKARSMAARS